MAAGMEILFSSIQSQISGPGDAVVCCLHWNMVTNGFKCIGTGENVSFKTGICCKHSLGPWQVGDMTWHYLPHQFMSRNVFNI